MTKTKKSFLMAGSIIGIVEASCMFFVGLLFILMMSIVDGIDLSLIVGEASAEMTVTELETLITMLRWIYGVAGGFMLLIAPFMLTTSIIVLSQRKRAVAKKGPIIVLLVLAVLTTNLIIAGFMIACLCIPNKKPIEIVEEAKKMQ